MIKITPPIPSAATSSPQVTSTTRVEPVTRVEAERKSNAGIEKPFVERRKANDRRNHSAARGPFDLRCGRDRRKNSRKGRFIETEA